MGNEIGKKSDLGHTGKERNAILFVLFLLKPKKNCKFK
jgi:hypothetical protein